MWDGSWWGDIGIAGYKYSNSTINTYLYNMQKVHNTCVCNIYVHIFPRRNHSANIPWSKIPLFSPPPPPQKKGVNVYIYIHIYIPWISQPFKWIPTEGAYAEVFDAELTQAMESAGLRRQDSSGGSTWRRIFASLVCFFKTESWSRWWNSRLQQKNLQIE